MMNKAFEQVKTLCETSLLKISGNYLKIFKDVISEISARKISILYTGSYDERTKIHGLFKL